MPDEDKKMVDIDTSGPDVDINLPEEKKDETGGIADIQVEETKETETTEKETTEELESWERIILKNHEIQIPHTKT